MTSDQFRLIHCCTLDHMNFLHKIRKKVLFEGRAYDRNHVDDINPNNYNFLFFMDDLPIGTMRLDFIAPEEAAVRLVAILPEYQGQGIGSKMLRAFEEYAKSKYVKKLVTNAKKGVENFYKENGFVCEDWTDPGEGIDRSIITMVKYFSK